MNGQAVGSWTFYNAIQKNRGLGLKHKKICGTWSKLKGPRLVGFPSPANLKVTIPFEEASLSTALTVMRVVPFGVPGRRRTELRELTSGVLSFSSSMTTVMLFSVDKRGVPLSVATTVT